MAQFAVRDMKESDLPRLMEIEEVSFPIPWTEDMFRCQLKLFDIASNLVVVEEGQVIGYITCWLGYDELHILSIAVIPRRRRRGAAEALLKEIIARGKRIGMDKVILEVRVSNVPAQKFYEKNGFSVTGRRKRYYSENHEDALTLELNIEK